MAPAVYESSPPLSRRIALISTIGNPSIGNRESVNRQSPIGNRQSDASRLRTPDVLMSLELEADGQPIRQDPLGELPRVLDVVDRRKEDRGAAADQLVRGDD